MADKDPGIMTADELLQAARSSLVAADREGLLPDRALAAIRGLGKKARKWDEITQCVVLCDIWVTKYPTWDITMKVALRPGLAPPLFELWSGGKRWGADEKVLEAVKAGIKAMLEWRARNDQG